VNGDQRAAEGLGQDGPVEGDLPVVAVAPGVGLEPGQVVAGLEVDDAAMRVQPVDTDLARRAAVLGPHDAFGAAVEQERHGLVVHLDAGPHLLDQIDLIVGQDRLALDRGPLGEGLRGRTERLAGLFVDGAAQRERRLKGIPALEDQRVRGASDEVAGRIGVLDQADRLLAVQPRAPDEVQELVAAEVTIRLGVVLRGGFGFQNVEIDADVHDSSPRWCLLTSCPWPPSVTYAAQGQTGGERVQRR